MTPEEFRRHGYRLVDWVAEYWESLEHRPVLPDVSPGEVRARLAPHPPEQPEPFDEVLDDLDRVLDRGLTHWQSPGWFAYFPANASLPSVLGELAAAGLAQQGMLWSTSPATTEMESLVLDWLVELLGLPSAWRTDTGPGGGVLQMSASDSTLTALVVARLQAPGPVERLVAYTSSQAHSSMEKGARVAGYQHLRLVPVDAAQAMDAAALQGAVEQDLAAGLVPAFIGSTVGTTGTTALDPLPAVADVAAQVGAWHHVDAAYAGTAMVCPELRWMQQGVERVDSYTTNPHKWLLTNFDCNVLWVADRRPLLDALSITPPYLRDAASDSGAVIDYRDWHVPLGRRFRALKLWFVLRAYGAQGLRHHIRSHVRLAHELAEQLASDPRFELVSPVPLGLVCFRCCAGDEATRRLAAAVNATGHSVVTPSVLEGRPYIRVSIGSTLTQQRHVDRLWRTIDELTPTTVEGHP
jgi:aromatic-L-amino-acid decarboxylase